LAIPLELGCIVEGHAEVLAVPILLSRLVRAIDPSRAIKTSIRRIQKSQLIRPGTLERAIEAITRQLGRSAPILVLLDADRDCPVALAKNLIERCRVEHGDVHIAVVVAKCEYEAWFLAGAVSLAGKCGLSGQLSAPEDPESIRGAKEWLSSNMASGSIYSETRHQPLFSKLVDLNQARSARSFIKLESEIKRILNLFISS